MIDGKEYILEKPLHADVALIGGHIVDKHGNAASGSTRNFNIVMAMAADFVIVHGDKIVEPGEIGPDYVETPGIVVDYIVWR